MGEYYGSESNYRAWLVKVAINKLISKDIFFKTLELSLKGPYQSNTSKGHFPHGTEGPCPLHFKHSHWWKRRSRSKSTSHYTWGTNGVSECKMDIKSTWIPTWHEMDHVSWSLGLFWKPTLGGRPNSWGDHGTLEYHISPHVNRIHGISIWLRARPHLTSHYTWGHVTTLHDFGSVLGQLLDTSFGLSQFHDHGSWLVCEVTLNWPWIWSPKC